MDYDSELQRHNDLLRRSYHIVPGDRVLDVGCGAGQTTRDAARLSETGAVLGVDVSASIIDRARLLAEADGLRNVSFEQGDAASHRFAEDSFDVAISRFGTMFFREPGAAFANIARAVRRNGRLVMLVWREQARNEWSVSIQRALAVGADIPTSSLGAPDPFSLADPESTKRVLESAGFGETKFVAVNEPVYYGGDVAAALEWVCGFSYVHTVMQQLDHAAKARAREHLIRKLEAHAREDGVWFDSSAWIISARRV